MLNKLLLLSIFYLPLSLTAQNVVDSLERVVATTTNDSLKMEGYNQLRKAVIYQDLAVAKQYALKYLEYADRLDLKFKSALGKVYLGNILVQQNKVESALTLFLSALDYFQEVNDERRLTGTYNSIAAAYETLGRDSLTAIYYQRAYDIAHRSNNHYSAAIASNNLSNVALRAQDYARAERLIRRAMEQVEKDSVRAQQFRPILQITLGNILVFAGRYAEADRILQHIITESATDNKYYLTYAYAYLGHSYLQQKRYPAAVQQLETAERLMNDFQLESLKSDLYADLATAYAARNNYRAAYTKLAAYQTLQDSTFTKEKAQALANALQKYEADQKNQQIELLSSQNKLMDLTLLKNQRERWALLGGLLALGLIAALIFRNNRLRARANAALEKKNITIAQALDEKNLLLKEIHHRVKNNLQVISSLLRLQSRYIDDETALEAIQESQNRVRSMSLLHQNLYRDDRLTDVEVQTYFNQLIDELFQSYQVNQRQIKVIKNIAPLQLDVDTVIPLGLIVNELITNALKYAFAEAEAGSIRVDLQENAQGILLRVRDDGIGVDPLVFTNSHSFGNRMIRAFAAKLEGKFRVVNQAGTVFELQMPL